MSTAHLDKLKYLLFCRWRQSISVIRLQAKNLVAVRQQVCIFPFITHLNLWQLVMVETIGLYHQMAFWQVKVAHIPTDRMLLNVFNLELIKDMSRGFFERGSLFAFDFAWARAISIKTALCLTWPCQEYFVADRTLFIEATIKRSILAFARTEFVWQIRRRLASCLKGYSAMFALALEACVMGLAVEGLTLSGAKVREIRFRLAQRCIIDTLALRAGDLRAAYSIVARTTTEMALRGAVITRLCFEFLAAASANDIGHKKVSYRAMWERLLRTRRHPIGDRYTISIVVPIVKRYTS